MIPQSNQATGSSAAIWDDAASSYDASRLTDPVYCSCMQQISNTVPSGTKLCLDAGCGTGLVTTKICPRCDIVVAVDYSLESLRILKSKGFKNILAVQADLTSLPFKDSAFDACVCANTLQHFKPHGPQERAINELERVTKEHGTIGVSAHHYSKIKQRDGWKKEGEPSQAGIDYIFRFSRDELRAIIPDSSIKGVGYYGLARIPFFGGRLQNVMASLFGRFAALLGIGHMLVAVAPKRHLAAQGKCEPLSPSMH